MLLPYPKAFGISPLSILLLALLLPRPANAQAVPAQAKGATPNSVILTGATHAETMQRLHVVRQYAFQDLRSNPRMALGELKLDFTPILSNSHALPNIALRLQSLSQHVQVQQSSSEISEVDEGLVIHHLLTYQILPGHCADASAKAQLAQAGASCFTRSTAAQSTAEFGTRGSPRYIADPGRRQAAIAAYQRYSAAADADAEQHIAALRKSLADPAQRAQIAAKVGQAETARLSTLGDDDLKEELIDMGVQTMEETMFVPRLASSSYTHLKTQLDIDASPAEIAAAQQLLRDGVPEHTSGPANFPKLLRVIPAERADLPKTPQADKVADLEYGPYIFLTGFTLGHDHEWKWGQSITVNWCVVGCSATYGFDLWAGYSYGFGLRFPIRTELKYHAVVHGNNSANASLTATFKPIQGTVDDFLSSGISSDQVFNAQELVAQAGAHAGFDINLPGLGASKDYQLIGQDLTKQLPPPFTNGTFLPPAPGIPSPPVQRVFDDIDFLGGLLNYGVVGGQLSPAMETGIFSFGLQFTLNDELLKRQTTIASSGQTVPLGIASDNGSVQSHFDFGNPVYNIGVSFTPGIAPNVFVDLGFWSNYWNFPIWFPQLTVDLPPSGQTFSCHAGTTCVLDFQPVYNTSTGQAGDVGKERDAADRTLTGGGCQRNGSEGNYLCPVNGMLGLCQAMLKNGAVSSCTALVPTVVSQILQRGGCNDSAQPGAFVCPSGMMGLCGQYVKNKEILTCQVKLPGTK